MAKAAAKRKQEEEAEVEIESGAEGETFVVDLDNVDENAQYALLPRGKYPATIESCEFNISQSGGNPMWSLQLVVDEGEYEGSKLFSHIVWGGKAIPRSKKTMTKVAPDVLEQFPCDVADPEIYEQMIGIQLTAQVDIRPYDGRKTNNVKDLLAREGTGESFLDDGD